MTEGVGSLGYYFDEWFGTRDELEKTIGLIRTGCEVIFEGTD